MLLNRSTAAGAAKPGPDAPGALAEAPPSAPAGTDAVCIWTYIGGVAPTRTGATLIRILPPRPCCCGLVVEEEAVVDVVPCCCDVDMADLVADVLIVLVPEADVVEAGRAGGLTMSGLPGSMVKDPILGLLVGVERAERGMGEAMLMATSDRAC